MNYNLTTPSPGAPGNLVMPNGWKAEWSTQYARYFYVNTNTKESTWAMPALPESQQNLQTLQRKPVPAQPAQSQAQGPVAQKTYIEGYPTPPPQVNSVYFPSPPAQQQQHPQYAQSPAPNHQQQYSQSPAPVQYQQNPLQQYPTALQQQSQYSQSPLPIQQQQKPQQQYPPSQQVSQEKYQTLPAHGVQSLTPSITPVSFQQQQRNYPTPLATPNSNPTAPIVSNTQYSQHFQQISPPLTPDGYLSQQPNSYGPPSYNRQPNSNPSYQNTNAQFYPSPQGNVSTYPQQANNLVQPYQQRQQLNSYQNQAQPVPQQYQQNGYLTQAPPQPQNQVKQPRPTSMIGSSLMGGNMMSKMSSKFTQLQTRASGPPPTAQSNGKPSSDWKKWAKRGAIGVAGIGALALGVDAAGDMLSGAAGMEAAGGGDFSGGGGDFSEGGGDFSGGGSDFSGGGFEGADATGAADAQTAVEANAAQHMMEGQGQENSLMLLDPPGTEYTMVNGVAPSGPEVGYGLI